MPVPFQNERVANQAGLTTYKSGINMFSGMKNIYSLDRIAQFSRY